MHKLLATSQMSGSNFAAAPTSTGRRAISFLCSGPRDEFELALGDAMTPPDFGNRDLVRCLQPHMLLDPFERRQLTSLKFECLLAVLRGGCV
jgi:hypothetical protein